METFSKLEDFARRYRRCVVSIGKFDGLHRGHAAIFRRMLAYSRELNVPSLVFTFDPTPAQILRPDSVPPALCDREQKTELLAKFGVDALLFYKPTRDFLRLSARDFFKSVLVDSLGAAVVVEGDNFKFGRDREGTDGFLAELCREFNVQLEVPDPIEDGTEHVSCSRIRELIKLGDVKRASELLGRFYSVRGFVEHGDERGRKLGFPTANLGRTTTLLPSPALYAGSAKTLDGKVYPAAINLGGNPTFGIGETKIEAHLLDFHGDLYSQPLELTFLDRVRGIVSFSSAEELIAQMKRDVAYVRTVFSRSA